MDYVDEPPETENPVMVIRVTAKCTLCETAERCDSPAKQKSGRESINILGILLNTVGPGPSGERFDASVLRLHLRLRGMPSSSTATVTTHQP